MSSDRIPIEIGARRPDAADPPQGVDRSDDQNHERGAEPRPVSMVNAWVRSMAPPSSSVSAEAATGDPDSTMHAPSQPSPSVLQALSVKIDPSRVGTSSAAPAFIRPRAMTNRPRPRRK